jgi:hypothetical protein
MGPRSPRFSEDSDSEADGQSAKGRLQAERFSRRIEQMPREVGVLLLTTGMVTGMLPPPPGPFDLSLMLAGGAALWPRSLRSLSDWTMKRFPRAHRAGMIFIDRYLDDLERRYPGTTNRYAPPVRCSGRRHDPAGIGCVTATDISLQN